MRRGVESLDAPVLEVLRLGAYQLLYMDGVPAYAAVSAAVDQARRRVGGGPSGLVNAVLRNVARSGDGPDRFPAESEDPATFLATWGSHPRWLVERWLGRWSPTEVRALVEANNRRPALNVCAVGGSAEDAASALRGAGLEARAVGRGSRCVRLARVSPSEALSAFPRAVVQDPASNLVAVYADIPPGTKVADLCAAPGGKLLAASNRPSFAIASDRSESRMRMVRDNAERVGLDVALVVADARKPPIREIDVVLVDVPCTGTGTLARHPDARWRLQPASLDEMTRLQDEILDAAADVVAPGGLLVYSTCSLEPEENEERVDALLGRRPDFGIEPSGAVPAEHLDARGMLSVTPQDTGFDGAFAVRLRKAA